MKLDIFWFVYGQYHPTFKKKLNPSREYKWIAKIKIYQFRITHTLIPSSGYVANRNDSTPPKNISRVICNGQYH